MRIEIFRPGTHTDVKGTIVTFAADDLAAMAAAYDPALHEAPIVVGHPALDAPAYGWVKSLGVDGERLQADGHQIDAAFAELVEAGRFKKVSASFWGPTAKGNPKPGVWYLRHVGFLGAAAPAIKGLKAVEFASGDDDVITVEFAAPGGAWFMRKLSDALRGMRDFLIDEFGQEKADRALPSWTVDSLQADAVRAEEAEVPAYAAPAPTEEVPVTIKTPEPNGSDAAQLQKDLEAAQATIAAFAEERRQTAVAGNKDFVEGLVAAARLPRGLAEQTLAFMERLEPVEVVEFAAADGKVVAKTELQAFKDLLSNLPASVAFSEIGKAGDDAELTDGVAFAEAIRKEQAAAAAAGESIDTVEALVRIKSKSR